MVAMSGPTKNVNSKSMYMKSAVRLLLVMACIQPFLVQAQSSAAARAFVALLNDQQNQATLFPFDGEERYNFHFVPRERNGITFNEMTDAQRDAAMRLIRTGLSEQAVQKAKGIMQLDLVLKELEKRKPEDHFRDPGNYHITIFGLPDTATAWGWKLEGHHVAFNFAVDHDRVVGATPGFLGANPGIVLSGEQHGKQVLADETEIGADMLQSLDAERRAKAIVDSVAPKDILSFESRRAQLDGTAGITYQELTVLQRQKLLQLISLYIHRYTRLFAEDMQQEIRQAGMDNIHFIWMGDTVPGIGHPHYYRVQGPTFLIEYDNTQNNANHVHSVIRDLVHDFGGDELLQHYKSAHAEPGASGNSQ